MFFPLFVPVFALVVLICCFHVISPFVLSFCCFSCYSCTKSLSHACHGSMHSKQRAISPYGLSPQHPQEGKAEVGVKKVLTGAGCAVWLLGVAGGCAAFLSGDVNRNDQPQWETPFSAARINSAGHTFIPLVL